MFHATPPPPPLPPPPPAPPQDGPGATIHCRVLLDYPPPPSTPAAPSAAARDAWQRLSRSPGPITTADRSPSIPVRTRWSRCGPLRPANGTRHSTQRLRFAIRCSMRYCCTQSTEQQLWYNVIGSNSFEQYKHVLIAPLQPPQQVPCQDALAAGLPSGRHVLRQGQHYHLRRLVGQRSDIRAQPGIARQCRHELSE
jgi:hypothetical protein